MAQVTATFTANIAGYTAAMKNMKQSTQGMQGGVSNASSAVSKGMSTISKVTGIAGAATTAMGVSSLKSYGTFQNSLNKAGVIAGGTSKDIKGLSDMANKMGADLPLSAQDAADAMIAMAQDGASINTIKDEFPAIARAATATGADLQQTAGTVQQAMNIWGDSLKSPERAAAILTETANLSNASVEDMSGAISNIGGVAKLAGYGMTEMTEGIGLLTNRGFTAQRASQNLSHAILAMQAPSDVAAGAMKKLGITYNDSSGKLKPFKQILLEVAKATDGMGDSAKAAALKQLFGASGMNAIAPLLDSVKDKTNNTATSWDAYADAMSKASKDGATSHKFLVGQAGEMQKNIGAKIDQVSGNWESLRNKSMESEKGVTGAMLDMINKTLQWSGESSNGIAKVIRSFIGLSPVIGPALTATSGFITATQKIGGVAMSAVKGIGSLGSSVTGAAGKLLGMGKNSQTATQAVQPLGKTTLAASKAAAASATNFLKMGAAVALIGAGVYAAAQGISVLVDAAIRLSDAGSNAQITMAALAAGIVALGAAFAVLGPALSANALGIGVFGAAVLAVGTGVAAFGLGINKISQAIVMLSGHMNDIVPVMANLGLGFAAMLTSFLNGLVVAIPQLAASFISIFTGFATAIASHAPQLVSSFLKIFISFTTAVIANAPRIAAQVTAMMLALMAAISTNAPKLIMGFTSMMLSLMAAIATNAPRLIGGFTSMLVSLMGALATNAPKLVGSFTKMLVSFINALAQNAPKIIGALANMLVKMLNKIAEKAPSIIAAFSKMIVNSLNAITKQMPKFIKAGADFIVSILDGIARNIGKIIDAAVNVVVKFIDGIARNLSKIINAGINLIGKFIDGLVKAIPKIVDIAVRAVMKFVYGVGYAIGKVMGSGRELMDQFVSGIKDGLSSARSSGKSAGDAVKDGVSWTDLFFNGSSIMSSFLNGLMSGWRGVQSFVSGIAGWIQRHKGPISYDKKLLIPAGNAIMDGLNRGLMDNFRTVKDNVSGMADELQMSIASVAKDMEIGNQTLNGASFDGSNLDQSIDNSQIMQSQIYVHNELVGDKIKTIVNEGNAQQAIDNKYFIQ